MQEKLHFIAIRLAKRGIPHYQIAFRLGITPEELRNLIVWDTLFRLASSGQNIAATLFWLRTRVGAVTKPKFDDEEDEELPPPPVFIIVDKNGVPCTK